MLQAAALNVPSMSLALAHTIRTDFTVWRRFNHAAALNLSSLIIAARPAA